MKMQNFKDNHITRNVMNKLASRGFGQSHLTVQTSNGLVTVTGSVQYAHQKQAAMKAIAGMTGIRRVVNQMTVKPATKRT
jgi:osmotically-inducible protein OsmY